MLATKPLGLAVLLAAVPLAGCTLPQATGGPPGEPPTYTFTATDFAFTGPRTIQGGWVELVLRNEGREVHHMTLLKLGPGRTFADVQALLQAGPPGGEGAGEAGEAGDGPGDGDDHGGGPPTWITPAPAVGAATPRGEARAIVRLEPGEYALLCFVPNEHGPHAGQGMAVPLTVQGLQGAAPPAEDATVELGEYFFTAPALAPGKRVVRVVNAGGEEHEAILVRLDPGMTAQDFIAAPPHGPFGGTALGGVTGLQPGAAGYVVADFQPGRYALICFYGPPGHPHFADGMVREFVVRA